jgi:hypothetical protein
MTNITEGISTSIDVRTTSKGERVFKLLRSVVTPATITCITLYIFAIIALFQQT